MYWFRNLFNNVYVWSKCMWMNSFTGVQSLWSFWNQAQKSKTCCPCYSEHVGTKPRTCHNGSAALHRNPCPTPRAIWFPPSLPLPEQRVSQLSFYWGWLWWWILHRRIQAEKWRTTKIPREWHQHREAIIYTGVLYWCFR